MLHKFLKENRSLVLGRCLEKTALHPGSPANDEELQRGISLCIDQLIRSLEVEQTGEALASEDMAAPPAVRAEAAKHVGELLRRGFSIEQVVHDYGHICESVTELATEHEVFIEIDEFRILNEHLDNAIADAVTEFTHQRDLVMANHYIQQSNHRIGIFAHELRNLTTSAMLALSLIRGGKVALNGATGAVLERNLVGIRNLTDRSLAEVRMDGGVLAHKQLFSLAEFVDEVKITVSLESQIRNCTFSIFPVDPSLMVYGDRDLLFSALGNLLQNAFKFTHPGTQVQLDTRASDDRILIEVEDEGPGLPADEVEKMFLPFTQGGSDRSGLGLGLSIAKNSVEANEGILRARNKLDGSGAIFTIDLPRPHQLQSYLLSQA